MQIYYTDSDPAKCAANLPDGLTGKILLEVAQILCTVCHQHGIDAPYKATHANHPLVKWANESMDNWFWLRNYGLYLEMEWSIAYHDTYIKRHKSADVIRELKNPQFTIEQVLPTEPPTVFVKGYPCWNNALNIDTTEAYRQYLNWKVNNWKRDGKCKRLYSWTNRTMPAFIELGD